MNTDPFNVLAPVQTHTTKLRPYLNSTLFSESEGCQVTPAYYQRPTEWGDSEVSVLCGNIFQWEEAQGEYWLASAIKKSPSTQSPKWNAVHFIHDLSLKGIEDQGVRKLAIIDGQQRTLTLRFILLVLLDRLYKEEGTLSGLVSRALYIHPDNEMHESEDRMVFEEADHPYTLLSAARLFPNLSAGTCRKTGEPNGRYSQGFVNQFAKYLKELGFGKGIGSRAFRHTLATELDAKGVHHRFDHRPCPQQEGSRAAGQLCPQIGREHPENSSGCIRPLSTSGHSAELCMRTV